MTRFSILEDSRWEECGIVEPVEAAVREFRADTWLRGRGSRWGIELGVVLGAESRYLPYEAAAGEGLAGYAVFHGVSERQFMLGPGPPAGVEPSEDSRGHLRAGDVELSIDELGSPRRRLVATP